MIFRGRRGDSYLDDDLDLAVEACGAALNQRDAGSQTHLVDMAAGVKVVKRIEDEIEGLEPCDVELRVLDVAVVGLDLDVGVELGGRLFGDLVALGVSTQAAIGGEKGAKWKRTSAFDFLMCSLRKRNWRLRLLRSMVSRSTMWTSPKPVRMRFLSSSQPMPPAPTMRTRA